MRLGAVNQPARLVSGDLYDVLVIGRPVRTSPIDADARLPTKYPTLKPLT